MRPSLCLCAGAALKRITPLVCPTLTCEFTTKVKDDFHNSFIWILILISFTRKFLAGVGKSHNDAASVRTICHIPASCGLYYFEVKIISKGRDGYMGIGLTASSATAFKMNRLPGKQKFLIASYRG